MRIGLLGFGALLLMAVPQTAVSQCRRAGPPLHLKVHRCMKQQTLAVEFVAAAQAEMGICNDTGMPECILPVGNFARWHGDKIRPLLESIVRTCAHDGRENRSLLSHALNAALVLRKPWAVALIKTAVEDQSLPSALRMVWLELVDELLPNGSERGEMLGRLMTEKSGADLRATAARLLVDRPEKAAVPYLINVLADERGPMKDVEHALHGAEHPGECWLSFDDRDSRLCRYEGPLGVAFDRSQNDGGCPSYVSCSQQKWVPAAVADCPTPPRPPGQEK